MSELPRPCKIPLWPHQQSAVEAATAILSKTDRAQIHMACGSGKTLVAGRMMSLFGGQTTVWLSPTIELMLQSLAATKSELQNHTRLIVAHSASDIAPLDIAITNDVDAIRSALRRKSLIFSTYASFPHLDLALSGLRRRVDLMIADEAHKTVGLADALFTRWLHPDTRVMRRLALTATPRVIEARNQQLSYLSMEDERAFGAVAYSYSFEKAVADGIICNVEALVPIVEGDSYTLEAKARALLEARSIYGLKRIMSFHGSIRDARQFAAYLREKGVNAVHVNGRSSRREIDRVRSALAGDEPIVVTNARLFGEGIDVPALDAVYFCDFKSSIVDVTQQIGRAVRRSPGKTTGYVILPGSNRSDLENVFRKGKFGTLWNIISCILDATESPAKLRLSDVSAVASMRLLGQSPQGHQDLFEKGLHKLLRIRRVEIGRRTWIARAMAVLEWLEAGQLPYSANSPHKEWISENMRALNRGELVADEAQIMDQIGALIGRKTHEKYKSALAYIEALENGGPAIGALGVLVRNNRASPHFDLLYRRMMAVRQSQATSRNQRRLEFLETYEKGRIQDRGMYAQFVSGRINDGPLNERFRLLHERRLASEERNRREREEEATRRFRSGEPATALASEYGVTISSIWYWDRELKKVGR